jgi:hypothetical protein
MKTMRERCESMIGETMVIRDSDYGVIAEFFEHGEKFIFVTDKGKHVDAGSYFRYLSSARSVKHYPDGSDYAARLRLPKSKTYNIKYVPTQNLRNIANVEYRGRNKRGGN